MPEISGAAEGGMIMAGSGCKNCPVKPCGTMNYRGSWCAAARAKFGLGDPKTNADRIREMTEEEMVDFLDGVSAAGCPCPARNCRSSCKECILDWLREPCEEDRYG